MQPRFKQNDVVLTQHCGDDRPAAPVVLTSGFPLQYEGMSQKQLFIRRFVMSQ